LNEPEACELVTTVRGLPPEAATAVIVTDVALVLLQVSVIDWFRFTLAELVVNCVTCGAGAGVDVVGLVLPLGATGLFMPAELECMPPQAAKTKTITTSNGRREKRRVVLTRGFIQGPNLMFSGFRVAAPSCPPRETHGVTAAAV
jgi:hypothetical protein